MATTMAFGFLTELFSRPDPAAPLDRWQGDPSDCGAGTNLNYLFRMIPHWIGFLPYCTAWWIILNNFYEQLDDLCEPLRDLMPDFVPYAIFGSFAIFSSFTLVQLVYQSFPPRLYYQTEFWYCGLSATAKLFLGALLTVNVISKRTFNEATAAGNYNPRNLTALCQPVA